MINELCDIFTKEYEKLGAALITDEYTLAPGNYAVFSLEDAGDTIEIYTVNKNTDKEEKEYKNFSKLDSMCALVSMNKPIDSSKIIHSNNMYSFYVKKDNLDPSEGKLNDKIIDAYYDILKNPSKKYKGKPKSMELYLEAEKRYGKCDGELLENIRSWIKQNKNKIYEREDEVKHDKTYLKLFYKTSLENYEKESQKYILPNIYNSTDYNVKLNGEVYGFPDFNMGLNSKKPYLENKTRKSKLPVLISLDKIAYEKKLFDYLFNYSAQGKNYIYADKNEITGIDSREHKEQNFNGYFLRVNKGKEVEIAEFDSITNYKYKFKHSINISAILSEGTGKDFLPVKGPIDTLKGLKDKINEIFFNKYLQNNFFTEPKDIKINNSKVREALIKYRYGLFTWFYKGQDNEVRAFWNMMTLRLLCNTINHGNINKAINQFNLRHALLKYFNYEKGGESMEDAIKDIRRNVDEKMNIKDDKDYKVEIDNDREYYFCIGQLLYYFYTLNKSGNKNYSFLNPILSAKTDKFVKEQLRRLFVKYNYAVMPSGKFRNLYYMIESYNAEGSIDQDSLIAGFLCPSLIYKK
jgi:CRISPR-associated protein Csh1